MLNRHIEKIKTHFGKFIPSKFPVSPYVKNLKSHPRKALNVHTLGVKNRSLALYQDYRVKTMSLFHDVGKIGPYFQDRLNKKDTKDKYTNHSYLSFIALLNYVSIIHDVKTFKRKPGIVADWQDLIMIGVCILKHHGGLPNLYKTINLTPGDDGKAELDRVKEFLYSNPYMPVDEFLNYVGIEDNKIQFPLQNVSRDVFFRLFSKISVLQKVIPDPLKFFFDIRMCFSALVAADKGDAGDQKVTDEITTALLKVYGTRIDDYLTKLKPDTELNKVRTEIRETCVKSLTKSMEQNPDRRVFSLTEPTGSGKTAILLTLAKVILSKKHLKDPNKVIYSIPFLSITEQIFDLIEGIFEKEKGCIKRIDCKAQPDITEIPDDFEDTLLKKIKSLLIKTCKGVTPRDELVKKVLLEDYMESTFNYPLIVTTFVQFFQSFTTHTNKGLMRFSYLQNSIFLIDEIQSLPSRLYSFFIALLDDFCRNYNCYAIISTATMPSFEIPVSAVEGKKLFKNYQIPIEIGDLKHFQYPVFNRYELHIIKETITQDILVSKVLAETRATLVVLNTVNDSREVYNALKEKADCKVFLMNSNHHAFSRRSTLKNSISLLSPPAHIPKEKFYLVTTQLIEAGVDIDFPTVYRDIAPIPNIIQTAGRCNREGRLKQRGIVYIFPLADTSNGNKDLRARYIYDGLDAQFLNYAIKVLIQSSQTVFEEKDLLGIQQDYFKNMADKLEFGKWEDFNMVDQINKFLYNDLGQYTVIPKKPYGAQERFYVPVDEKDDSFEKLLELIAEKEEIDTFGVKPGADKIREIILRGSQIHRHLKKMMDRVVQVTLPKNVNIKNLIEYEEGTCYMYKLKPGLYDSEYGLYLS
jgi:CRISPR-associated endonuclease/helicase Cas3